MKRNISGHPENFPYPCVLCYLFLHHEQCIAHHVAQAASFFKQEVKSDTSDAGHRTTGYVSLEETSDWTSLTNLLLKAGSGVRPDQVSRGFIQLGLEMAVPSFTCSGVL